MALTERQQEIVNLQKQGKKASEIAQALGISTNAVYQQLRRMRGGKGGGSTAKATGKSGRQSARKTPAAPKPAPSPAPAPVAAVDPGEVDPTKLLRQRHTWLTSELKNGQREIEQIKKDAAKAVEAIEKAAEKHQAELTGVEGAIGVLSGGMVAHNKPAPKPAARKPAAAKKSGGTSNGKPEGTTAPQTAPQASVSGASGASVNDGSGSGTQPAAAPAEAPATA
jgi:hypothetical protein